MIEVKCNDKIKLYANSYANISAPDMLKALRSMFVFLIEEYIPEDNWDFLLSCYFVIKFRVPPTYSKFQPLTIMEYLR